ncbi:DUF4148 domain-containing protein [Rhodoferax sp.]|uniref:DUF4148 domain-containing protein n=1 Tax=Rhodoferax sp. TaxID=50421 RepID=UPI00374DD3D7
MTASKFAASALIALASVAATSAFAGNDNGYPRVSVTSTKTRAAVQAELAQARQDGTLLQSNDKQYPKIVSVSTRTRAEVRAEYEAALKAGEIVRVHS